MAQWPPPPYASVQAAFSRNMQSRIAAILWKFKHQGQNCLI